MVEEEFISKRAETRAFVLRRHGGVRKSERSWQMCWSVIGFTLFSSHQDLEKQTPDEDEQLFLSHKLPRKHCLWTHLRS